MFSHGIRKICHGPSPGTDVTVLYFFTWKSRTLLIPNGELTFDLSNKIRDEEHANLIRFFINTRVLSV